MNTSTLKQTLITIAALFVLWMWCDSGCTGQPQTPGANADSPAKKYFTDVVLVNQNGEKMRFYSDLLQGKVVIINSFFATCAGSCLPLTRNLEKLQQALGARMGKDVHILSISVDPDGRYAPEPESICEETERRTGLAFPHGRQGERRFRTEEDRSLRRQQRESSEYLHHRQRTHRACGRKRSDSPRAMS